MGVFQSAKVYVIDYHFNSDSKEEIAAEKVELDKIFDQFVTHLNGEKVDCVEQVFLRKH